MSDSKTREELIISSIRRLNKLLDNKGNVIYGIHDIRETAFKIVEAYERGEIVQSEYLNYQLELQGICNDFVANDFVGFGDGKED